jgi:hypothetical protein
LDTPEGPEHIDSQNLIKQISIFGQSLPIQFCPFKQFAGENNFAQTNKQREGTTLKAIFSSTYAIFESCKQKFCIQTRWHVASGLCIYTIQFWILTTT